MLNQIIIDFTYINIFWPIRACETEFINSISKYQVYCLQKLIISTVNLCSLSVLCSFICLKVFVCVINHHTVSYNSFRLIVPSNRTYFSHSHFIDLQSATVVDVNLLTRISTCSQPYFVITCILFRSLACYKWVTKSKLYYLNMYVLESIKLSTYQFVAFTLQTHRNCKYYCIVKAMS